MRSLGSLDRLPAVAIPGAGYSNTADHRAQVPGRVTLNLPSAWPRDREPSLGETRPRLRPAPINKTAQGSFLILAGVKSVRRSNGVSNATPPIACDHHASRRVNHNHNHIHNINLNLNHSLSHNLSLSPAEGGDQAPPRERHPPQPAPSFPLPARSASFGVAMFLTEFTTRPGIPWGSCSRIIRFSFRVPPGVFRQSSMYCSSFCSLAERTAWHRP